MVKGGCTCEAYQKLKNLGIFRGQWHPALTKKGKDVRVYNHVMFIDGGGLAYISFCPFCGTKLTPPPEEVKHEAE